ncbi:hypothetical protein C8039_03200 [Halogeometricum sp. wsp3]|nr:hypothetical protein C8039_03200 [Halogeometricum sp. wsp3]
MNSAATASGAAQPDQPQKVVQDHKTFWCLVKCCESRHWRQRKPTGHTSSFGRGKPALSGTYYSGPRSPVLSSDTPSQRRSWTAFERTAAHRQRAVDESMDAETRSASQAAFYNFEEDLRWYRRRTDLDRPAARWTLQFTCWTTRLRLALAVHSSSKHHVQRQLSEERRDEAT